MGGIVRRQKTALGRTNSYRTVRQADLLQLSYCLLPQADYIYDLLGVIGEYVLLAVTSRSSATGTKAQMQHLRLASDIWQPVIGFMYEASSYIGMVRATNFNPAGKH